MAWTWTHNGRIGAKLQQRFASALTNSTREAPPVVSNICILNSRALSTAKVHRTAFWELGKSKNQSMLNLTPHLMGLAVVKQAPLMNPALLTIVKHNFYLFYPNNKTSLKYGQLWLKFERLWPLTHRSKSKNEAWIGYVRAACLVVTGQQAGFLSVAGDFIWNIYANVLPMTP